MAERDAVAETSILLQSRDFLGKATLAGLSSHLDRLKNVELLVRM